MLIQLPYALANESKTVVIAHAENKAEKFSKDEIKKIFLGKRTKWDDDRKIIFVTLSTGPIHKEFLKTYVGKTPAQYNKYWKKQIFTGKGKPPKSFKTEKQLLDYVSKTKGALGYISRKTLSNKSNKIQIIKIEQ